MNAETEVPTGHTADASAAGSVPLRSEAVSIGDAIDLVSRHRRLITAITAAVIIAVLTVTLLWPARYTAYASFVPEAKGSESSLAAAAAQFGVRIPLTAPTDAPEYYADVLLSRDVLRAAVQTEYDIGGRRGRESVTLIEFYDAEGSTAPERIEDAVKRLKDDISVSVSGKNGIVRLAVTERDPRLASAVVSRLLGLLSRFNTVTRQSKAAAERQFTGQRMAEVQAELRDAEDRLQTFLQRNRDFRNAPALVFEQERLASNVTRVRQLYTALSQAYEQARIEGVRDTPVFTIVETPVVPARQDSRAILFKTVAALLLGLSLGLFAALARDALTRDRVTTAARAVAPTRGHVA